jgi:pyruvate kinase
VPTRAEITDVANAAFEQADAIMLSGETTIGRYPVECVDVLNRVAVRIERSGGAGYAESATMENIRKKTAASAVLLANSIARSKLVVFTRHGRMARYVSNLRPERATVFAFTPSEEVRRQLTVSWGVCPQRIEFSDDPNETIETAVKFLRDQKLTSAGDNLVVVSDVQARGERVDCVLLRTIK